MAKNLEGIDFGQLDWEPESRWESTKTLYGHVQGKIQTAIDWYYEKKEGRRRGAQWMRRLAWIFGVAGIATPLSALIWTEIHETFGYLFITLAGSFLLANRVFGFLSGWVRYVLTAQELQEVLEGLQFAWVKKLSEADSDPPDSEIQAAALELLETYAAKAQALVHQETEQWAVQFQEDLSALESYLQKHKSAEKG